MGRGRQSVLRTTVDRRRGRRDRRRRRPGGARARPPHHRPGRRARRLLRAAARRRRRSDRRVRRSRDGCRRLLPPRRRARDRARTGPQRPPRSLPRPGWPTPSRTWRRSRAGSRRCTTASSTWSSRSAPRTSRRSRAPARMRLPPGPSSRRRREADALVLAAPRSAAGSGPALARLVRRSVLVLDQLTDRATGGIVAAPEMDGRFVESGGYGFVWPRDLSYVVLGLLAAGRARAGGRRASLAGPRPGARGAVAPALLDDGGARAVVGPPPARRDGRRALRRTRRRGSSSGTTGSTRSSGPRPDAAPTSSLGFLDPESGLPKASVDLWEQQDGQHAYTAASVVGGLKAAGRAAARHGDDERARAYRAAAAGVAAAIDETLWDAASGRHLRAVNVARAEGGTEAPAPPSTARSRTRTGA